MSGEKATNGGVGFLGLLTILFIAFKLTHVIDWSWWLVLAPLLVPIALVLLVVGLIIVASVLSEAFKH